MVTGSLPRLSELTSSPSRAPTPNLAKGTTDRRDRLLGCLDRNEVSDPREERELVVGKRVLEAVGPSGEDDRIELPPGDHRGLRDLRCLGSLGSLSLSRRRACPVVGDARPDRSGPRVGINDRFELPLADRPLPAAPMVVELFQVQAHGLPVVGDEPIGPGQGVEVLVPELALHRGIEPPLTDPRVGRVEQGERPDALRPAKREGLGDGGADVVGGYHRPGDPQPVEEGKQVLRQDLRCVSLGRRQVGLIRVAEPPKIRGDHVGDPGERHQDAAPVVPEPRPSVQKQDGLTSAEADVVEHDAAGAGDPSVSPGRIVRKAVEHLGVGYGEAPIYEESSRRCAAPLAQAGAAKNSKAMPSGSRKLTPEP
jgi:hypothetical protein